MLYFDKPNKNRSDRKAAAQKPNESEKVSRSVSVNSKAEINTLQGTFLLNKNH